MLKRFPQMSMYLGAILVAMIPMALVGTQPTLAATSGSTYTALSPVRILDTRTDNGTLGPNSTLNLQVAGTQWVPSAATAVVINVTVTNTTAPSYLSVYPTGGSRPNVSNLNWVTGSTTPNLVTVPVGTGGDITFYNNSGKTDVVVDLQGYFAPSGSSGFYAPLTPARIADTRPNSGEPYANHTLSAGQSLDIQVSGAGNVPTSGVTAVALNVTATDTTAASFAAVYPAGETNPGTSTLNWGPGQTVANRVIVPLGTNGQITVYNSQGNTDFVVDVSGYFASTDTTTGASYFYAVSPTRVLDTRVSGNNLGPATSLNTQITGLASIPTTASAVVMNLTATNTTSSSFFNVAASPGPPLTSDLNWSPGQTRANLVIASPGNTGNIYIYNHQGSAAAIVDVFGYFQPVVGATSPPANTSSFVQAAGTQLTLNGAPYRFSGINVYMAASNGTCGGNINLTQALSYLPADITFRFWAFQPFFVSNGQFNWTNFNNVLSAAAARGDHVIPALGNEWNYCDGPAKALAWYQGGYATTVQSGDVTTYKNYVTTILSLYKNNPTILMWELMNEAQAGGAGTCPTGSSPFDALMAFGQTMGALARAADPNHLIAIGYEDGSCGTWGSEWQALNNISYNDVCDYHNYGYPSYPMGNPNTTTGLQAALNMCHADNKPMMVAETGIIASSPSQLQTRADEFTAQFNAQFSAGVVGELMWCYTNLPTFTTPTNEDYGIFPPSAIATAEGAPSTGDPSLAVVGTF